MSQISNDTLVFSILPFLTSFDANTRLKEVVDKIEAFNSQACKEYCSGKPMPKFNFTPYGCRQSYSIQRTLFNLKDLGLIE